MRAIIHGKVQWIVVIRTRVITSKNTTMDYEKAYNEALERAKSKHSTCLKSNSLTAAELLEDIFPELRCSDDERIRKAVKHLVNSTKELHLGIDNYDGVKWIDILSWLEKQGQEKTTWVKEDEIGFIDAMWAIEQARTIAKNENDMGNLWYAEKWLKSLKERYTWKPSDEQIIPSTSVCCAGDKEIESL